jgi:hypothetical protein
MPPGPALPVPRRLPGSRARRAGATTGVSGLGAIFDRMTGPDVYRLTQYARGGGCACKIPPGELEEIVGRLMPDGPGMICASQSSGTLSLTKRTESAIFGIIVGSPCVIGHREGGAHIPPGMRKPVRAAGAHVEICLGRLEPRQLLRPQSDLRDTVRACAI